MNSVNNMHIFPLMMIDTFSQNIGKKVSDFSL